MPSMLFRASMAPKKKCMTQARWGYRPASSAMSAASTASHPVRSPSFSDQSAAPASSAAVGGGSVSYCGACSRAPLLSSGALCSSVASSVSTALCANSRSGVSACTPAAAIAKPLYAGSNPVLTSAKSKEKSEPNGSRADQTWTAGAGATSFGGREAGLAELLLRACALGAPCGELASALADAVLDSTAARLALQVREGGAHSITRAIELAEGSPHLMVGRDEKFFRHSSLGAAVCNCGNSYTRKLAESRA